MKCPGRHFENPNDTHFCAKKGTLFPQTEETLVTATGIIVIIAAVVTAVRRKIQQDAGKNGGRKGREK
jgi:hypothetical protein